MTAMQQARWPQQLAEGVRVRFAHTPQPEVANKLLAVGSAEIYEFSNVSFTSWQLLEDDLPLCSMIVAESSQGRPYLALSRCLNKWELQKLFAEEDTLRLYKPEDNRVIFVREHIYGLREWVTMKYTRRICGVEGKKIYGGKAHPFSYALYVSETNDRAIELELHEGNRLEVYVTVYRPCSDVEQLLPAPARRPEPRFAAELPEETPADDNKVIPIPVAHAPVAKAPEKEPLPGRSGEVMLECEPHIAARIISEAVDNDMRLSDLIRKVLGLPVYTQESVHFKLPLSEKDYRALAGRYGLEATQHGAIHELILQELAEFTGERPRQHTHAS